MKSKTNKYTAMKVSPEFRTAFKTEAATRGMSIFDLSVELARKNKKNEKKIEFKLTF